MNILTAIFLGALQGLTEFLPVSSSGHLVLAQSLIPGFSQPGVLFDTTLHAGTLLAVLFYFRKKILSFDLKYFGLLAVASVPAALAGILFSDFFESLFSGGKLLGLAFVFTGAVNILSDNFSVKKESFTVLDSLIVGVSQAVAIIPGVSRSGSTIFAGVARGIDRKRAAEFSFLLSVPAIAGAGLLQVLKYNGNFDIEPAPYLVGFAASLGVGFFTIRAVINSLVSKNFKAFGIYCLLLGGAVLLFF